MALKYSKEVEENFMNPKNLGEMKNPSGVGKIGNPACGDIMHLYIKVNSDEVITDIKFKTFGCAAAIATSSMITQMAKGKKVSEAGKIKTDKIAKSLKGLPPIKVHCASMAAQALGLAIEDYEKRKSI
ncbi:iron-sulfur cluster assembly scaffold protein [archaeon]|jgi:nitrogen fixation protein NifU and related proteins|nr:iron-sulfur cluster assembly scaffold protein [archaeon]